MGRPRANSSFADKEMDKAEEQLNAFESNLQTMTLDRMNMAPKEDVEPQTKLSQKQLEKTKEIYLKPHKSIGSREKFNEDYREKYNYSKEYVYFTAENKEIIGEAIDIWTKPYAGMPAEWWKVPVNTPVWGPRYLAEQIKSCSYHRFTMKQNVSTGVEGAGEFYGAMAVDTVVQRLDAVPASRQKSIFMGANAFA